jgi:hypothetical protein
MDAWHVYSSEKKKRKKKKKRLKSEKNRGNTTQINYLEVNE